MSKFFKNIWTRCIGVLLIISLISGGLLAILNDVLYVSDEERTARSVNKLYDGQEVKYDIVFDSESGDDAVLYDNGEIIKFYKVNDGKELLFKSTGYNGYKNGTITLWVKIVANNNDYKIDKVVLESYTKQTLMSKLSDDYYNGFLVDVTDTYFTVDSNSSKSESNNPVSGATKSATAGSNAVNCVIKYINENVKNSSNGGVE